MISSLVHNWGRLRERSIQQPAWAGFAGAVHPGFWLTWWFFLGSYLLYRGLAADDIDETFPVGVALPGSQITEALTGRPITDGDLFYAVRGVGPLGIEDDADPPDATKVTLIDGEVQLPVPNAPLLLSVEPAKGGDVLIRCIIDNYAGQVPAASLSIYTDGGLGEGVDWETPVGDPIAVGSGRVMVRVVRDFGLEHGDTVEVGLRAKSAQDAEETNTNTRLVTLDAEGPPAMADFTAEPVLNE